MLCPAADNAVEQEWQAGAACSCSYSESRSWIAINRNDCNTSNYQPDPASSAAGYWVQSVQFRIAYCSIVVIEHCIICNCSNWTLYCTLQCVLVWVNAVARQWCWTCWLLKVFRWHWTRSQWVQQQQEPQYWWQQSKLTLKQLIDCDWLNLTRALLLVMWCCYHDWHKICMSQRKFSSWPEKIKKTVTI